MPDLRRISAPAIVLLVVVRIAIGWQFTYEGLWKLNSQQGPKPWTSAGYLKNARGPFRNQYRNITGDPNDLAWLDYDSVAKSWDDWHDRLLKQHPDLTAKQKERLDALLNGPSDYRAILEQMPEGVRFGGSLAKVATFDAKRKRLIVDGKQHLIPAERDAMLRLVQVQASPPPEDLAKNEIAKAYQLAVRQVYSRSSRLSIKEQARVLLKGDPNRASQIYEEHAGTLDHKRIGNIDFYQILLARYETNLANAETVFQHDHLQRQWAEIQQMRADLVGPVKALDADLKKRAQALLTPEQLARGPVPMPMDTMAVIDRITIFALLILGVLLMTGLFSRLSAAAAAGLLLSFYLAMPPWPGVIDFQELPGPDHSFLVDKNLIEIFALLAIAAMPTGQWFGVDTLLGRLLRFGKATKQPSGSRKIPQPVSASTKDAPRKQEFQKEPAK